MGRRRIPPVEHVCEECGVVFMAKWIRWQPRRFCGVACSGKYNRRARGPMHGADNPRFTGGLSRARGRTIIVLRDGTYEFYSRALMAAHLGRELLTTEIVHHINHDPTNDRIENLAITTRSEHIGMHHAELLAARKAKFEARKAKT